MSSMNVPKGRGGRRIQGSIYAGKGQRSGWGLGTGDADNEGGSSSEMRVRIVSKKMDLHCCGADRGGQQCQGNMQGHSEKSVSKEETQTR